MAKRVSFFNCYSINLHNFLKASGVRYMSKNTHTKGISIKANGEWKSYSTLRAAAEDTKLPVDYLEAVHADLQSMGENYIDDDGFEFAKRVRHYWVYLVDDELDRLLKVWEKTGPKNKALEKKS